MSVSTIQMLLQQNWMSIAGPKTSCSVVHPGSSCIYEILHKMLKVMKRSLKMYTVIYTVLFLFKLKKTIQYKKLKQALKKTLLKYIGSLLFMSWLTGGMKTALCLLNKAGAFLDHKAMVGLSLVGSTSIYLEDPFRRGEIGYFTVVRSLRSLYILLKKRFPIKITQEQDICFIIIFGILAYIYIDTPKKNLKNRNVLQKMWGIC